MQCSRDGAQLLLKKRVVGLCFCCFRSYFARVKIKEPFQGATVWYIVVCVWLVVQIGLYYALTQYFR